MASFTAAGTAYATHATPMVPFFIFYSMFGFQRVGDLIWAFGDMRGRGFLLGATAGRTTLNGEGLQHEDGHSQVLASTVPNVAAYDPAFAYEVADIVQDGMRRMYGEQPEDVFYYLTLYNENYVQPAMPPDIGDGITKGLYRFADAPDGCSHRATILFSGTAQGAAREAQALLAEHHDVAAELWSATSYKALREDALEAERWNRLHPTEHAAHAVRHRGAPAGRGPVRGRHRLHEGRARPGRPLGAGLVHAARHRRLRPLRHPRALRRHFETDAAHVVVAVLDALARAGEVKQEEVADAIARYDIDADAPDPRIA